MVFATGFSLITFLIFFQSAKGSQLDESLQKKWISDENLLIELFGTSLLIHNQQYYMTFYRYSCVQEIDGFRHYRSEDYSVVTWMCIKILKINLPDYLHLSIGSSGTHAFCSNCRLYLVYVFTEYIVRERQECSDLDKSLQKQWFRISATIEFSATSVGIDWFGNGILTFSCVQETGGFRLYRIDVPRDFIEPWICIKIVNTNLPGYLHLSFGSSETSDFCTNCKVYPAVVFTDSPEPPVLMPCNKPGICPVTDSTDVLCPKTSELNLFCQRLMIILNGESSEDDSTEDDDSDDSGDFRARLLARAKGGKKIGQLLNGGVKGNGKGKKLGHCKKRLAEEIILQCEPVTEPAIAE